MIATCEMEQLLEQIARRYGSDFTGYSRASLMRRIDSFYVKNRHVSFTDMQSRLIKEPAYFMYFVEEITVNVTEMFRDAVFYKTLR